MACDPRELRRKLPILEHAHMGGDVSRTCRYFGIGRASFYRWRQAYEVKGEASLASKRSVPRNHPNKTPAEVADKVLHLRREYHLGPMRIVWYLARYHGVRISDAGVHRILCRNGLNRLPRGTRVRKIHTIRYNKQVPGHHVQMDVKFSTFMGKRAARFAASSSPPSTTRPASAPQILPPQTSHAAEAAAEKPPSGAASRVLSSCPDGVR